MAIMMSETLRVTVGVHCYIVGLWGNLDRYGHLCGRRGTLAKAQSILSQATLDQFCDLPAAAGSTSRVSWRMMVCDGS